MKTHSPGPWGCYRKRVGALIEHVIFAEDESAFGLATIHDGGIEKRNEANARLVTAAPKLLAACKEALELRNKSYQVDANNKLDGLARRKLAAELHAIEGRIRAAIYSAGAGDPENAICQQCGEWLHQMEDRPGYRKCTNRNCRLDGAAVLVN